MYSTYICVSYYSRVYRFCNLHTYVCIVCLYSLCLFHMSVPYCICLYRTVYIDTATNPISAKRLNWHLHVILYRWSRKRWCNIEQRHFFFFFTFEFIRIDNRNFDSFRNQMKAKAKNRNFFDVQTFSDFWQKSERIRMFDNLLTTRWKKSNI